MGAFEDEVSSVAVDDSATVTSFTALPIQAVIRLAKRRLLRMHYEAGVGHIGGNLSCLDALIVLHHRILKQTDSFILSKGHSAGSLYVALWTKGIITDSDLATFHQDDTLLGGHPISNWSPHIPFATGSLGHGFPLACGLALGKKLQKQPGQIYCLMSDGEWQEGSNWEALIFAAHNNLTNLTVLVDENGLQGFGSTKNVASIESVSDRLSNFGIDVVIVDGHRHEEIEAALRCSAMRMRAVILKTKKGNGVSFMEDQMAWHYLPMTREQYLVAVDQVDRT